VIPDGAAAFTYNVNGGNWFSGAHINAFDGATKISMSVWFRSTASTGFSQQFASQGVGLTGNLFAQWTFNIHVNGSVAELNTVIATSSSTRANLIGSQTINYGTLYHVLCVFDGTQSGNSNIGKYYLNGVLDPAPTFPTGNMPSSLISVPGVGFAVGSFDALGQDNEGMDGTIGSLCVWPGRALQQADATTLYNSGTRLSVDQMPLSLYASLYCAFGFKTGGTLLTDYMGNVPLTQNDTPATGVGPVTWQSAV
jgi:hypothetical protein